MPDKRNKYIDFVKGTTIILVVLGHCIQYGSGNEYLTTEAFFSDTIFKFIYGFHMPLFMAISGYLFYFSINKHTLTIITEKLRGLILPLITWHTLYQALMILLGTSISASIFIYSYFHTLWFLRALFFCCMISLVINRIFQDKYYIYILVSLFLYFIPHSIIPNVFTFTATFFIIGYLLNKYKIIQRIYNHHPRLLHVTSIMLSILYLVLLNYYEHNDYVYCSGTYLFNKDYTFGFMVFTNLYRNLTALCGCILMLSIIYVLSRYFSGGFLSLGLSRLSISSLCIYIINNYINETLLISLPFSHINYLITILETVIIVLIGYLTSLLCKTTKLTNLFFIGGR